jgi:glycine dehydrogenase subunit 1
VAELCTEKAHYAAERLTQIDGVDMPFSDLFFKEFVIRLPRPVKEINIRLAEQGIMGGLDLEPYFPDMKNCMLICVTEQRTKAQIDRLAEVIAK